jgi:hypothetical protein
MALAMDTAGNICPPVPPPLIMTFKLPFMIHLFYCKVRNKLVKIIILFLFYLAAKLQG